MHKRILIILLLLSAMQFSRADDTLNFVQVERKSLELYNASEWKELVHYGNKAFRQGIDYYFLRMRVGTGYFEMSRYMQASYNFEKALEYNSGDPSALEYLYYSYLYSNQKGNSREIYKKAPPSLQKKLKATGLPGMNSFNLEGGPQLSDQQLKLNDKLWKAENQLYTETDIIQDGSYITAGARISFSPRVNTYFAYSEVMQHRTKLIHIHDAITQRDIEDAYKMNQQQAYINLNFKLSKSFSMLPAFHFVKTSFKTVEADFDRFSERYTIKNLHYSDNQFIASLSLSKDFRILNTSVFVAMANLNNDNQTQAGVSLTLFPLGNLNFYTTSTLINHYSLKRNRIIFDQKAGIRLFKPLWLELTATFGELHNYFEKNAFIVYNIPDQINFKTGSRLMWTITKNWMITLDYLYLERESSIFSYQLTGTPPEIKTFTKPSKFTNQFILGGIQWTF